jgi:hypothetical protein
LIYSFKNEIHSSCFNLREKINKHNTRGVKKKKLPSAKTPWSALRERQCFSPLRAHAHNKQHAAVAIGGAAVPQCHAEK